MKSLSIALAAIGIMAVLFVTGLLSGNPLPLFVGFCGWSPAMILLGWSVRTLTIGKRLRWETVEADAQPAPVQRANSRLQEKITRERSI